ncbi:MAG: glycosyltransferase family 4 protein, partial [Flavobacterium sp.]|nr:glycosyltransferase family 4 protein [Pedobacter sp.]
RIIIKNDFGISTTAFSAKATLLFFNDMPTAGLVKPLNRLHRFLLRRIRIRKERKIQQWIDEADVIFSNTITNGDFLAAFNFNNNQLLVSYIHELKMATSFFTNETDINVVLNKTNIFCVPSNVVSCFLNEAFNVPLGKIKRLNYFIPPFYNNDATIGSVNTPGFTVGLIGTLDWRKGAELLPLIIDRLIKRYPNQPIHFRWKGVHKKTVEFKRMQYELTNMNIQNQVTFEEASPEVWEFYSSINLLLLCSKEDPYPLVVLEAASFKKPCICFENAGGAPEFIQKDAGTVVPFMNIDAVCDAIYDYSVNKQKCISHGHTAFVRYQEQHLNAELIINQFKEIAE